MEGKNPFTLTFGKEPIQYVSRMKQSEQLVEEFCAENPTVQSYLISGVRGSGKTVMLTSLMKRFEELDNWIVVELNPTRDMLQELASKLYENPNLHGLFLKAKFNFSLLGLGAEIENSVPVSDIETVLQLMLSELKKDGKRLLVAVDEVSNTANVRMFTSAFQILIRQDAMIFLIMTGLYENIYELQNEKSLTFLYRAPKLIIEPLSLPSIANIYRREFMISMDKAAELASLTMGYAFAFQLLGYLLWKQDTVEITDKLLSEFDQYLSEYVYEKIWSELSEQDRFILCQIAQAGKIKIADLKKACDMESNTLSVYRERLKRKGVIDTATYGYVSIALPRLAEYIKLISIF